MYKVLKNKKISSSSYLMEVVAPFITKACLPGQFVIVMALEDSERIPLTIYDYDKETGVVSLIYQVIGASTLELTKVTDGIFSISGPLGRPNEICKNPDEFKGKRIVYVAGGVGIAPVYPQVKYLKDKGFSIDVIYGSRNKDLLLIRDEIEKVANKVSYATDDGSFGLKGFVTNILEEDIHDYDICVAIGPVISMNPLMVDGSGMCGACRCEVEGKPKFACVDGPEFDGHKINFDLAMKRMNIYKAEEEIKLKEMKERLGEE